MYDLSLNVLWFLRIDQGSTRVPCCPSVEHDEASVGTSFSLGFCLFVIERKPGDGLGQTILGN